MSFRRQAEARASHSLFLKLESRLVFDAAAGATVAAAVDDTSSSDTSLNPDAVSLPPLTDGDDVADPALKEVAFVDAGLTDVAELVAGIREGVEVVMLDTGRDGLLQITDWLASHGGIDAVHIYSHGSEGQIQLGAIGLTVSNVDEYSPILSSWRDLLSQNADILIYGCNVGAGSGVVLTETLALYTGADVAASIDLTGSSALGGNWTLEQTVGTIDVTNALTELEQQQYAYILPPAETWTISNQSVSEGGLITFTLTRANGSGSVNVNWATSTGTASATDFTSGSGTLAFSGNESKTFTVQTTQDAIYESSENFTVNVTGLTGATASKSATGTISNDDAAPTFSIAAASGSEANAITFTVTRSGDSEVSQTVNYSTASGTATRGTDFTAATGTLTFDGLSGNTKTFSVQTTGDGIYEASETFSAEISWGSGGGAGSASATGTIVNADAAPVFSITPSASGSEGGTITFTVTMDRSASMAQTVDYAVAFGTASAGDFVTSGGGAGDPLSGTLSFAAGQTSKTITLKAATDAIYEGAETFSVALSNPAGGSTVGTSGSGTGSIANTTSAPVFTIAPTVETTAEGGMLTYTVTMDRVSTFEQSVDWSVSLDGKTASLSDFDATTYPLSGRLVFAAGETSRTFTIATSDDAIDEVSSETFTVALANPLGDGVLGSASSSAGSITDNDVPTFSIVQSDPLQTDVIEGQSYDFNVGVVSGAANTSYVLTYDISGRVSLADFSGISSLSGNAVTITTDAGGIGTTSVRLQTATDSAGEKTEALSVTLKDGNSRVGQLDTVVIDPKVTISSPTSATGSEAEDVSAQQAFSFTLSVTGANTTDYQVQFRVDGSGGAPAAANDYRVLVGGNVVTAVDGIYTVTVSTSSRGAGALDVMVAPVDDALDEPDETLTISLVESLGLNLTGNTTKTLTILDNDVPTFSVAQDAPTTVSEGDTYDFAVSVASGAANSTYRLSYTLSGGSIQAADFTSGSLTGWVDVTTDANGVGSANVNLGIARDADVSKEQLTVTLNGGTISGQSVGQVNAREASISTEIVEPLVTISRPGADASSVGENVAENQAYQFTIAVADGARNGTYTVNFRLDGEAVNGASSDDYRVVDASGNTLTADANGVYAVTVAAGRNGQGSINVTVIPVDDAVDEPDETVTISLVQEGTDATLDGDATRTLTIIDDDVPTFSLVSSTPTDRMEGQSFDFDVTVDHGAANTTYVVSYILSGSGVEAGDFDPESLVGTVEITTDEYGVGTAAASIQTISDRSPDSETVKVELTGATVGGLTVGVVNPRADSFSVAIHDPVVTISRPAQDVSDVGEDVSEQQAYQFVIALDDGAKDTDYTVKFRLDAALVDGTSAGDYVVLDENGVELAADDGVYTVTVHAGNNRAGVYQVTVMPVDDAVDEPDETVTISLVQEGTDATLDGDATRTLTIIDDDVPELSVGAALGVEGGGLYVDIVSSIESTSDLEVDFIIVFDRSAQPDDVSIDPSLIAVDRDGNPTSVDDVNFFGFQGTARIASGDTSVALRIGGTLADGDARETFSVFLTNARKVGSSGDEIPTIDAGLDVADNNAEGFSGQIFGRAIDYVVSSMTFLEDGTGAEFTITRYGDLAERTYDWDVLLNGTADAADFEGGAAPSGSVTFAAGQDTAKVTLPISRDTTTEAVAETFSLRLSSPGYGWPSSFDQNYLDSLSTHALNDLGKMYDAENQVFFTLDPINQGTTNPGNSDKGEIEATVTEQLAGTWIDPSGSELTLYLDYQKAPFVNDGLIDEADLPLADSHIEADVAVKLYVNGLEFDVVLAGDGNDWTYDPNYRFGLNGNQTGAGIFKVTVDFSQIRLAVDPSVTLAGLLDTASMEAGDSWRIKFIDTTNGNRVFEQAGGGYNQRDAGPNENGSWQARYAAVGFNFAGVNSAAVGNIIDDDFGLDLKPNSPPSLVMNMPMDVGSMTFDLSPMFQATPTPISDLNGEPTAEGTIIAPGLVNSGTADIGSYLSRNPNLIAAVAGSETLAGRGIANGLQGMANILLVNESGGDQDLFEGQGNAFGVRGADTGATQEGGAAGNVEQPPADNNFQPQAASEHRAGDSYTGLPEWLLNGDIHAAFPVTDAVARGQEAGFQLALLKERNRFNLEAAALYRMVQEHQVAQEAVV